MSINDKMTAKTGSVGVGFCELLTLLFIALKLTGYINWSWFWVLSPMIFTASIAVAVTVVLIVLLCIELCNI